MPSETVPSESETETESESTTPPQTECPDIGTDDSSNDQEGGANDSGAGFGDINTAQTETPKQTEQIIETEATIPPVVTQSNNAGNNTTFDEAPVQQTQAPAQTEAPAPQTEAPVQQTQAPAQTEAPAPQTEAPVQQTQAPAQTEIANNQAIDAQDEAIELARLEDDLDKYFLA